MPLVRAALACSLDGFIATADGGVDWLGPYFTAEIDFPAFMAGFGATIMGRRTFDAAMRQGHGMSQERCTVLTHRPLPDAGPGVEGWSDELAPLVAKLRGELQAPGKNQGKDIWLMGGGEAIAAFQAADLIDRYEISVMPVLLGEGLRLFPRNPPTNVALRCTGTKTYRNGIVALHYQRARQN